MFNLESQMLIWKSEIEKIENLTNDDIEELKSHIIDKIDDLQNRGYTLEESFNISINKIGSNDLLSEEYKKVNNKLSAAKKITYGIIGFIGVNFIFQIANIIAIMISASFANKLLTSETINIPIVSQIIVLVVGESFNNNLSVFTLIVSIILSVGVIYLILSKKKNIIISFIEIMEKVNKKKIYYFMLSVIMPISMFFIPSIFRVITMTGTNTSYLGNILIIINFVDVVSLIVLTILFINEISKNNSSNRYKLTILSGYIVGVLILNILPSISTIALVSLGITSIIFLLLFYSAIALLIIYCIVMEKSKTISNIKSNKKWNIGVFILAIVLLDQLFTPLFIYNISVAIYMERAHSIELIKVILIIALPCISYIYILIENINHINKKQKVKS